MKLQLPALRQQLQTLERESTGLAIRGSLLFFVKLAALITACAFVLRLVFASQVQPEWGLIMIVAALFWTALLFGTQFALLRRSVDAADRSLDRSILLPATIRFGRVSGWGRRVAELELHAETTPVHDLAVVCPAPSSLSLINQINTPVEGQVLVDPVTEKPAVLLLPSPDGGECHVLIVIPVTPEQRAMAAQTPKQTAIQALVVLSGLAILLSIPQGIKFGHLPLSFVLIIIFMTIVTAAPAIIGRSKKQLQDKVYRNAIGGPRTPS